MLNRLRQLRQEKGLSQQKLAAQMGISQQSVNKYENHNVEPDIAMLTQMADLFGTTIDYLVGHSNDRTRPGAGVPAELTASEAKLLCDYRKLSDAERESILLVMENYLKNK